MQMCPFARVYGNFSCQGMGPGTVGALFGRHLPGTSLN